MKFGRVPLAEAQGAILAHGTATPGARFKKGRVLSAEDVEKLRSAGVEAVVAAQLTDDDIPEDEAAARLAKAVAGPNLEAATAFTGRCNLISTARGVVLVDGEKINRFNATHEALTIATLRPYDVVQPGQMVATVKVIPFSAPGEMVSRSAAIAAEDDGNGIIRVVPLKPKMAGLVMTRVAGTKNSLLEKTAAAVRRRLVDLGCQLVRESICDHHEDALAPAIRELAGKGCSPILVFGASAIVDRRDVVPMALARAGGVVEHFGMPVDPGNLLMLGHLGETPVVGVPGCARSPKLNGFDWVLQRLVADLTISPADITAMGVGGLLKEIPSRPQPREGDQAGPAHQPRIAAIVLAAGQSRRMGTTNKLTAAIDGVAMVARVVEQVLASPAEPVVVVTGHEAERVREALAGYNVRFVHNPGFASGLSSSVKAGVAALVTDPNHPIDGAVVCLGDMPAVTSDHIRRLIAAFDPVEGRAICVPTCAGKRGNPVLWGAQLFPQIQSLSGDVGAKHLIGENEELVCEISLDDEAILTDIDTQQALSRFTLSQKAPS